MAQHFSSQNKFILSLNKKRWPSLLYHRMTKTQKTGTGHTKRTRKKKGHIVSTIFLGIMNHFIYYVKEMKYSCYRNSQVRRLRLLKILEEKNQKRGKKNTEDRQMSVLSSIQEVRDYQDGHPWYHFLLCFSSSISLVTYLYTWDTEERAAMACTHHTKNP